MVQNQKKFFLLPSGQQARPCGLISSIADPCSTNQATESSAFLCLYVHTYAGPFICMCLCVICMCCVTHGHAYTVL